MGNVPPSRFDPFFRNDDFDDLIQEVVMAQVDSGAATMGGHQQPASSDPEDDEDQLEALTSEQQSTLDELNRTLTKEEWNTVAVFCRSSSSITVEEIAQTRSRLQALWSDNKTPRNCPESSLLFAFVCFLEAALGGTDLPTVSNRLATTCTLLECNIDESIEVAEEQLKRRKEAAQRSGRGSSIFSSPSFSSSTKIQRPTQAEQALTWTASLSSSSCSSHQTWGDIAHTLKNLTSTTTSGNNESVSNNNPSSNDSINSKRPIFTEPLKSWLTCLIIASYCAAAHRTEAASDSYSIKANARNFGFFALSVAYKTKIGTNAVADRLWSVFTDFELEENLSTLSPEFHLSPQVSKWEDVPKVYVGQNHAIKDVGDLLRAKREGLLPSDKPNILLLFGPSGHGKTELAKNIAKVLRIFYQEQNNNNNNNTQSKNNAANSEQQKDEEYFFNLIKQEQERSVKRGDEDDSSNKDSLLILNMANYCTETSLYSLIDPPSGIVGEGGLIRAIEKNPKMVIVADEFEKSTSLACNNLWLPAFESNGKLASGKDPLLKVSTKDVTFVLTCNICDKEILAGAQQYHRMNEEGKKKMREEWISMCGKKLCDMLQNNAFLPRISKLIPFVPFTDSELQRYASLQVEAFQRHQLQRGVQFFYSRPVIDRLSKNIKNFHARSIDAALLEHMLKLSDAKADSLVLTLSTEKPKEMKTEAILKQTLASASFDFSPNQSLTAFCGASQLEDVAERMGKSFAGINPSFKQALDKVISWMKNNQLLKERRNAMRTAAKERLAEWQVKAAEIEEERRRVEEKENKLKKLQEEEEERQQQQQNKKRSENEEAEKLIKQKEEDKLQALQKKERDEEEEEEEENRKSRSIINQPPPVELPPPAATSSSAMTSSSNQKQDQSSSKPNLQFALQKEEAKQKKLETVEDKKEDVDQILNIELIQNLKLQVKELAEENTNLKVEVKHLKNLVKSLQTALAISLIAALSFMMMASLFIPFKVLLLTAAVVAFALNYFIANFTDIVVAACKAVYEYLGPRNLGGIAGGFLVWGLLVGMMNTAPPCAQ